MILTGRTVAFLALSARPRGSKGFEGEFVEGLVHPRRPGVDVGDDGPNQLAPGSRPRRVDA